MHYQDYLRATQSVLTQMQKRKRPYKVRVLGHEFAVNPGVFSPRYFRDTEIFARMIPVERGDAFLEIGSGTGAIGILAILRGARKALLTGISHEAVSTAKRNVVLHRLEDLVEVRQGDLFGPLKKGERFSKIFWNVPFGYTTRKSLTLLEGTAFDCRYEHVQKYLVEARAHLLPRGRIFIGFSSTLGRLDVLAQMAKRAQSKLVMLNQQESREGQLKVKFELFEVLRF